MHVWMRDRSADMGANTGNIESLSLGALASTGLLTLSCHAQESRSPAPILRDPGAEALFDRLLPWLSRSGDPLHRRLARGKVRASLVVYIAMRARRFDRYAREFVERHPPGCVVDLGCGLDTRFQRIDDGRLRFFDLDLPEVIALKRELVAETDRYRMIARSVLDHAWMDEVTSSLSAPPIFLAEGLFMYLPAAEVRSLVIELQRRFPGAELVFEAFASRWLTPLRRWLIDVKMQRQLGLGEGARFVSGLRDGREPEGWSDGIHLLDEWVVFDEREPKLGFLQVLRRCRAMRSTQWTVHYALDAPAAGTVDTTRGRERHRK